MATGMATRAGSDTAILVQSEVQQCLPISQEEISLDLGTINGDPLSLRFGCGFGNLDSPSECTTLSTISTVTATPLDQKHRYHLYFAYHKKDQVWVQHVVQKLENEPHNYKCCFPERDFEEKVNHLQNILCSIMLSRRVIVVLTPHFIEEMWDDYEDSISHLTSLTLRKHRVIPVLLEECEVPDSLRMLETIDVRHGDFWDNLFMSINMGGFPYSESMNTIRSLSSSGSGFSNGQLLTNLSATIKGFCHSHLIFDHEEVPDPLISHDVSFTRQEYADLIRLVGREEIGQHMSWLFTALPTIILVTIFVLWCIAFILVIILFPDNSPSTLPVRLCVFALPAVFIVLGCIFRWRKVKSYKEKYSICMFSRSVQVNKNLYEKNKSVILTTARTHDDTFHERIKMFLTHCTEEDIVKLSKLIEVYTLHSSYLEGRPIGVRLAIMMSAAYAIQFIFKRIPHTLEQRHTRRRQCLCQFVEEFLASYLPCLRSEADVNNLKFIFLRYLNCQLKPDPIILHTLGIHGPET